VIDHFDIFGTTDYGFEQKAVLEAINSDITYILDIHEFLAEGSPRHGVHKGQLVGRVHLART
jgi:hypothetical protein